MDGCARDPELALLRNGTAAGELARACARRGIDMVFISTNEVFDGRRTDGIGYAPGDARNPINPYGAAQGRGRAAGDRGVRGATVRAAASASCGPPGSTVRPAATSRPRSRPRPCGRGTPGHPSRWSRTRSACPTYTPDLAEAIVELVAEDAITAAPARWAIHHLVNSGRASRADWAREVLRATRIDVPVVDVPGSTWKRPPRRRPGRCSRPRPCRRASRCATGARPSPTPSRPWCVRSTGADPTRPTPTRRQPHPGGTERATGALTIPRWRLNARAGEAGRAFIRGRPSRGHRPSGAQSIAQDARRARRRAARDPRHVHPGRRTGRPAPRRTSRWRSSWAPRTTRRRSYRSYADQIYSDAIRYTSNVVRVYSPNATASRVQAAVAGASIIVYLGHGNGWPSPYTYDPAYTTKDGFGLNYDTNGDGKTTDYENKYYGEPWIRGLRPAPNAVVLLFHLCYASGNPESGAKEPNPVERHQARGQLRGRLHQGRRPRRHRERPQPRPVLHRCPVHHPPDHRPVLAQRPGRARQRHDLRVRAQPRLHVPAGPGEPRLLLPVHRRHDDPADPGRDRGPVRGHRRGPAGPRRPGQRQPRRSTARRSTARVESAQAGTAPIATLAQDDEGARRRPRAGDRVGRPVADLPRPHHRRRGLDDRLGAAPARQHGAAGLGGR